MASGGSRGVSRELGGGEVCTEKTVTLVRKAERMLVRKMSGGGAYTEFDGKRVENSHFGAGKADHQGCKLTSWLVQGILL